MPWITSSDYRQLIRQKLRFYDEMMKVITSFILIMVIGLIISCRFYFNTTKDQFNIQPDETSIANGKNLAFNICAGCHYNPDEKKFTGRPLNDLPRIAGKLFSANLTHSVSYGRPPDYTDAELFYLLKTGISKSGKFMPYMMRPMMADDDVKDIIAFLRSEDPSVASADINPGKTHINLLGRIGIRVASEPQPYQKGIPVPDQNDPIAYGKYLVGIIGCYHCHSKKVLSLDYSQPDHTKGYLQGGIRLKDPQGHRLRGPNLTPDSATGIGNFTINDFKTAITEGIAPSGQKLSAPMPRFTHMTDQQVQSIYAYLKSLPPVKHTVPEK
jgi:mono/diheme cytochrome c family protein